MRVPSSIIFWKWTPDDLDPGIVLPQVDELCDRSVFSAVAIGLEHAGVSYDSDIAHATIAAVADRLRQRDRHLVLSIDPRQEPRVGERPSGEGLAWVDSLDLPADEAHVWESVLAPIGDHFGIHPPVGSQLLAAWRYRLDKSPGSQSLALRVDAEVGAELGIGAATVRLPAAPGHRHLVLLAHWLDYPDVFADSTFTRHRQLLERYANLPIAGAAIDEWGPPSQPGRDFSRAWSHPWWSTGLAHAYERDTSRPLLDDLFHQQVAEEDREQTAAIVNYFRVLRERTAEFETFHFDETRRVFGDDAFVGFHPTWWGVDEDRQSRELFKNGLNWWAARRDVAQTDEVVPMGVRLALTRKAGQGPFFNMWYAMATGDVRTHFRDAWYNARYGGRTHHHSFRCAREGRMVLALADTQALEAVSAMEERIDRMAAHFGALVDCPVLVVAGWEAAVDWRRHVDDRGEWEFSSDTLSRAYRVLRAIWEAGYLAELVPDYESLGIDGDRIGWCGHAYDAALFVDSTPPRSVSRARSVATGVEALEALAQLGVAPNPIPDGCRLEDGTILIAPAGGAGHAPAVVVDPSTNTRTLPPYDIGNVGNRFSATLSIDGHTVEVEADDFVVIPPRSLDVIAGALHRLVVDGVVRK